MGKKPDESDPKEKPEEKADPKAKPKPEVDGADLEELWRSELAEERKARKSLERKVETQGGLLKNILEGVEKGAKKTEGKALLQPLNDILKAILPDA